MSRKPPYKPLVHNDGAFTLPFKIIEHHGPMMDFKDREALIFPDKVRDNTRWNLSLLQSNYFKKEPGREIDEYDDLKTKYFQSNCRGLGSIKTFITRTERAFSSA